MVMRSLGGVRSFKISPVLIVWSLLFFIAFTIVSIFAINGYLNLRRLTAAQERQLGALAEKSNADLRDLQKARQRIALLREYIRDIEKPRKEEREPVTKNKPEPPPEKKREPAPEEKPEPAVAPQPKEKTVPQPQTPQTAPQEQQGQKEEPPAQKEEPPAALVDIRDLEMRKEGDLLMVDFKLVNLDSGEKAVGGYVHTIANIEVSAPLQQLSYPVEKLKEGMPVNYRRGQPFLIQRFRPMKARFDLTNTAQPPSSIRFIVYDQSGKLMLEKAFEVKDDL